MFKTYLHSLVYILSDPYLQAGYNVIWTSGGIHTKTYGLDPTQHCETVGFGLNSPLIINKIGAISESLTITLKILKFRR